MLPREKDGKKINYMGMISAKKVAEMAADAIRQTKGGKVSKIVKKK